MNENLYFLQQLALKVEVNVYFSFDLQTKPFVQYNVWYFQPVLRKQNTKKQIKKKTKTQNFLLITFFINCSISGSELVIWTINCSSSLSSPCIFKQNQIRKKRYLQNIKVTIPCEVPSNDHEPFLASVFGFLFCFQKIFKSIKQDKQRADMFCLFSAKDESTPKIRCRWIMSIKQDWRSGKNLYGGWCGLLRI